MLGLPRRLASKNDVWNSDNVPGNQKDTLLAPNRAVVCSKQSPLLLQSDIYRWMTSAYNLVSCALPVLAEYTEKSLEGITRGVGPV